MIFADGYESSTIVAGVRGINRDLWRNDSELYYNGNMDWNMDLSEVTYNGTYYFRRCYDYRTGY